MYGVSRSGVSSRARHTARHVCASRACNDEMVAATLPPAISAFITLSGEKWKKHSRTGGYTGRRTMANGRRMGTGQPSRNHLSSTGGGVESSTPASLQLLRRLISDQVLMKCQNVVPSPTAWLSDTARKTPSASSVTCAPNTGRDTSAPNTPFSGKSDHTTGGM
nr:unnamed protein product [Digitaria exilis]